MCWIYFWWKKTTFSMKFKWILFSLSKKKLWNSNNIWNALKYRTKNQFINKFFSKNLKLKWSKLNRFLFIWKKFHQQILIINGIASSLYPHLKSNENNLFDIIKKNHVQVFVMVEWIFFFFLDWSLNTSNDSPNSKREKKTD